MSGTRRQQEYTSSKYKGLAKGVIMQPKYSMKVVGAKRGRGSYKQDKHKDKYYGYQND